ncbi:MAG TPA: conditioned medium-induced protein 4 [Halococcus sp.]|nr:conditioned medium-induced protein 4 [Halococcus sp.]
MDEKTEELRDIFMDLTDEESVTERQEDTRGSLAREGSPTERTEAIIEAMTERYEFDTDLTEETLVRLVRAFYDDASDVDLTELIDESRHTVFGARMDLHLVRESDLEASFELDTLRERLDSDMDISAIATDLDVAESTIRRYRNVIETQQERRAVGDRFREAFDEIYLDTDLASHTEDVTRDGLDEATEGMENELSF